MRIKSLIRCNLGCKAQILNIDFGVNLNLIRRENIEIYYLASHGIGQRCVGYNISIIPEDSRCFRRSTLNTNLGNRPRQREGSKETMSFQLWKHNSDGVTQLFQGVHTNDSPKEKELVFQTFLLGSL